jgi:hypothetical protein
MLGLHQPVRKPRAGQRVVWFLCLWIVQTFYFGMCVVFMGLRDGML